LNPSSDPSRKPSVTPSSKPSQDPSIAPSASPSSSTRPSVEPSAVPTLKPSDLPSLTPSSQPSYCSEHRGKTFFFQIFTLCLKLEVFVGGTLSVGQYTQTTCNSANNNLEALSHFTSQSYDQAFYDGTWSGNFTFTEDDTLYEPRLIILHLDNNPNVQDYIGQVRLPPVQCTPSEVPSDQPSVLPSNISSPMPSNEPSAAPSLSPSAVPSAFPSVMPSLLPSASPSDIPSSQPSYCSEHRGKTFFFQIVQFCLKLEVFVGGTLSVGQYNALTCNSANNNLVALSHFTSESYGKAFYDGTWSGNFTFIEDDTLYDPALTILHLDNDPTVQDFVGIVRLPPVQCTPSEVPSDQPSALPSGKPSQYPSSKSSDKPSLKPSSTPSSSPSSNPSDYPSSKPSDKPSLKPSSMPSAMPSSSPSSKPSESPSDKPSYKPSSIPSFMPSSMPSLSPSSKPSASPSDKPSVVPSSMPSLEPSQYPSILPSAVPSTFPSILPSLLPSVSPSATPSGRPSLVPTSTTSSNPPSTLVVPSRAPSYVPSLSPTGGSSSQAPYPSEMPSQYPSEMPSQYPSEMPSELPSEMPSEMPSQHPTCKNAKKSVQIKGPVKVNGKDEEIQFKPDPGPDGKKGVIPRKFISVLGLPFETTTKKVCKEFTLKSECTASKEPKKNPAPDCEVTIELSYCDKGKNCGGGKDDGCRSGTITAKGQGAKQYTITGGGGDFRKKPKGTFDAEFVPKVKGDPKSDVEVLDKVDINFSFIDPC
jgi:hypothetical protein